MIWDVLRRPGLWSGGGMGPSRLDRAEVLRRLGGRVPDHVIDPLLDAYEPAAIEAANLKRK